MEGRSGDVTVNYCHDRWVRRERGDVQWLRKNILDVGTLEYASRIAITSFFTVRTQCRKMSESGNHGCGKGT